MNADTLILLSFYTYICLYIVKKCDAFVLFHKRYYYFGVVSSICFALICYIIEHKQIINIKDTIYYFEDAKLFYSSIKKNGITTYIKLLLSIQDEHTLKYIGQTSLWYKNHWTNYIIDNRIVIKYNSLLLFFSSGNFFIHTLISSFIILYIKIFLIHNVHSFFSNKRILNTLFVCLFLIPSINYFAISIHKEAIVFMILFLYIPNVFKIHCLKNMIQACILSIILFFFKPYLAFFIFPIPIILHFLDKLPTYVRSICYIMSIFILYMISNTYFDIIGILIEKQKAFITLSKNANSSFYIPLINNGYDILSNTIQGFINCIFQPQLLSINKQIYLIPIAENICITVLFSIYIYILLKKTIQKQNITGDMYILAFILSCVFIGEIVPIHGAIYRYRSPIILFLLVGVLYTFDRYLNIKKYIKSNE